MRHHTRHPQSIEVSIHRSRTINTTSCVQNNAAGQAPTTRRNPLSGPRVAPLVARCRADSDALLPVICGRVLVGCIDVYNESDLWLLGLDGGLQVVHSPSVLNVDWKVVLPPGRMRNIV